MDRILVFTYWLFQRTQHYIANNGCRSQGFTLIQSLGPLDVASELPLCRQLGASAPSIGRRTFRGQDRQPTAQHTHTCCVALSHTDIELVLGEQGCMVIHITDLDDEDQGVVHVLSCQTTHNIEVNLGSRELR